jgi:TPP-dependent pyruvate/acetoin dehydrogenase alpha subunit
MARLREEQLRDMFEMALLARRFEDRIQQLTMAGELPGSLHPGAGQEIEQLAALAALRPDDKVLCGHRGILYMIARGITLEKILADIGGREGGTNRGKGGCMHTVDPSRGMIGQSGTLGGGFVISVGVGMALKRFGRDQVVACFFGEGTSNRGTFHESLNWAAVQRLPCVYVCENNGYAVSVPASVSTAVSDIADRAVGYGVPGVVVDGDDPDAVFSAVSTAVNRARAGEGPSLIEAKVTRLHGHYIGDQQEYRSDAPVVVDPLAAFQDKLVAHQVLNKTRLAALEDRIAIRIEQAVATMRAAPPLAVDLAFEDLYA